MAMYSIEELWKRWQLGTLMVDQAMGQVLQHMLVQEKRNKPPKPKSKKRPKSPPKKED